VAVNTYSANGFLEGPVPSGGGTVTNLEAVVDTAPGVANGHTIDVMDNTTGTVLLSCQITGTNVFCINTGSASATAGDYLQVRMTNTTGGTSNAHSFRVTFRY
jgi:hypothetical protein